MADHDGARGGPGGPDVPDDVEGESGGGFVDPGVTAVSIGLVFLGGTIGTSLRELITFAMQPSLGAPTLLVNIVGAFVLAVVTTVLLDRRTLAAHRLRLFIGTGVLGGFTTYSAFATVTASGGDLWPLAAAYGLGTVVGGALATGAGIGVGGWLTRTTGGSRA